MIFFSQVYAALLTGLFLALCHLNCSVAQGLAVVDCVAVVIHFKLQAEAVRHRTLPQCKKNTLN